ncbi:MAG: hypothetical protein RBU30_11355 [Polyangia bacterium]|jgi:hypothetical protein|nr:hypothetical protein [Polyangia bacterium]
MGVIGRIIIGLLALGALGGVWAALAGYGASPMKGAAVYQPNVRSGSVGHSRTYYHGGKY